MAKTPDSIIHQVEIDLDQIITRLLQNIEKPGDPVDINENECETICRMVQPIFEKEPMFIELDAPIKVVGDLHGQFYDLLRLLELCGNPPNTRYLFLGDYVDRGPQSIEVLCLLFAYKIKYPDDVFMLRGNHECDLINRVYGFREEIRGRYGKSNLRKNFLQVFNFLPVAASIANSIFCTHGGLSPDFLEKEIINIKELLNEIPRPTDIPRQGYLCDLLWADPAEHQETGELLPGWSPSTRGCSWHFGFEAIDQFLDKFGFDLIVRAHQVVEDGYEFYHDRKLITIFSAPNYCNQFDNAAAVFVVKKANKVTNMLEGGFQIIKPQKKVQFKVFGKDTSDLMEDD